ncbi:MAG: MaoC family dehydratase N-terminal domain-containing protein [Novosphingobium sp.]
MTAVDVAEQLDTTDVDRYVGRSIAGGQLKDPIAVNDIRRWVQGLDYLNPIHFDEAAAARTRFGGIVAPQSFTVNCDVGHGSVPALVGLIPGSHVIFGGDEWWFYGPRVRPGDKVRVERKFDGYKLAHTKFAGPSMFSRGDTLYVNERNEAIAKQRSTMVRYRADLARARGHFDDVAEAPTFSKEQLREYALQKKAWAESGLSGAGPGDVAVGDALPVRPIGPHSKSSFQKEFAALLFTVWGSHSYEEGFLGLDTGWIPELSSGEDDLLSGAGPDEGPASSHGDIEKAKLIGMPRHFGYGSSMGAWALDYAAFWGGDDCFIRHARIDYRYPIFEHDVTLINASVIDVRFDPLLGVRLAVIEVVMTNQDGTVVAKGPVTIELARL